ncbi:MAG: dehypoxanthine futalosine cyclase, partial [Bacteroidetes bacterium HGW-Bacteroidetes-22]
MKTDTILNHAVAGKWLSVEEAVRLFYEVPLPGLMQAAHTVRKMIHSESEVSWIIDRNVNYTNICNSGCKFCNFFRTAQHPEGYIINFNDLCTRTEEMFRAGGRQLLLQGGMNPKLGLDYFVTLFRQLKKRFPLLKLHALGPPEIVHLSRIESLAFADTLKLLIKAGLDSLPGAGGEVLADRVRKIVSPVKCSADEWLEVMHEAHKLDLTTTATMMFGHVETISERMEHLVRLREVQRQKPEQSTGFIAFILWPFQDESTVLIRSTGKRYKTSTEEYVRMVAISRLMLPNIRNIGASWLTVGVAAGQVSLWAGANDFGS